MKIFLVISSFTYYFYFLFFKDETEVSDEMIIKLDKEVEVKKLKKESFLQKH